ncbi:MAG: 1,4-alpha-glucan branching enzyme [Phenylobacterium sp.]|jgi:1,4-alpha-glucan branching enzyme
MKTKIVAPKISAKLKAWLITFLLMLTPLIPSVALADGWLDNDANAIWQRAPGVYKEGDDWYVIFHGAAGDTDVKLQGDFTNGTSNALSLTRTPDGLFWWFKGTDASFSRAPLHGDKYLFSLVRDGATITFQDPAARWVTTSNLTLGQSRIHLSDDYQWQSTAWQRPGQDKLNIYQLHPLRFTDRNGGTPLQEVTEELDNDGSNDYINNLGVTAVQLLPVNEFAGDLSWGYNPSFFYAIESSFGGPDHLKAMVDKAHQNGIAVILDLEFNHVATGDNILWALDNTTYIDGDTVWGGLYNFDDPVAKHFLIQNVLYLAKEFHIDGFRFDHTNTIHNTSSGFVTVQGSGGGWDFLRELYGKTKALDSNIWFTAEELPDWWGITADDAGSKVAGSRHGPMDSQWVDTFHDNFKAVLTGGNLDGLWSVFGHFGDGWQDATVYTESHDEVGNTDDRIAKRGRDGKGWEMSQIALAGTVLSRGTPMAFMGQEAGETTQFHIDWWDDRIPLTSYETDPSRQKMLSWYQKMNEIRGNDLTTLASGDSWVTHIHNDNGIATFTRADGKYVVVMNFKATTWFDYDVGVSGYYRELANTSWPQYNLSGTTLASRGEAQAFTISNVHIPAYGVVVLQKEALAPVSVDFSCQNGWTQWGQNVYVVGNIAALGNWDSNNAVKLAATGYPTWTGNLTGLPANTTIEWKCIKRDVGAVVWQSGGNNSVTTSAGGSVSSVGAF